MRPVSSMRRLLDANRGQLRRPDGSWFHHDARFAMVLVALPGGLAAVQIQHYDTRVGTDIFEGGTFLILGERDGALVVQGRAELPWGLVGRDRAGAALVLRYAPETHDRYLLGRLMWESIPSP